MDENAVFVEIAKFERRLGLPAHFYLRLLDEDDWGFVIKLHSLFEGAATHVLNLRLGAGKLESALAHLDFGDTRCGKTRLLLDLGILATNQHTYLRELSEIRNLLVHEVRNVSFSFETYLGALDSNQFKAFCDRIGYNTRDNIKVKDVTVPRNKFIRENAKLTLWLTGSDILGCLLAEEQFVELEALQKKIQMQELSFARKIDDMFALTPLALRTSPSSPSEAMEEVIKEQPGAPEPDV